MTGDEVEILYHLSGILMRVIMKTFAYSLTYKVVSGFPQTYTDPSFLKNLRGKIEAVSAILNNTTSCRITVLLVRGTNEYAIANLTPAAINYAAVAYPNTHFEKDDRIRIKVAAGLAGDLITLNVMGTIEPDDFQE